MAKPFFWLIIVWSVICASGLAIYLLQAYRPVIPGDTGDFFDISTAAGFWLFVWVVPTAILAIAGRRK